MQQKKPEETVANFAKELDSKPVARDLLKQAIAKVKARKPER